MTKKNGGVPSGKAREWSSTDSLGHQKMQREVQRALEWAVFSAIEERIDRALPAETEFEESIREYLRQPDPVSLPRRQSTFVCMIDDEES